MNESKWAETQAEFRKLEALLPSLGSLSTPESPGRYSYLTPEQLTSGRRTWLTWMIRRGWKFGDDGQLHKGEGREHQSTPPIGVALPFRPPWDPKYNPRVDAPAAFKFGATMIGPNRYRLGMFLLDANGALRDEANECPVCGCSLGQTYRVVRVPHSNPYVARDMPWVQMFSPCPRCAI